MANIIQSIVRENVGPEERLRGFVFARRGRLWLTVAVVLLLMPLILVMGLLLAIPGLVWLTWLFAANYRRLDDAGASMGWMTVQLIFGYLWAGLAGIALAVEKIFGPLTGHRFRVLARTDHFVLVIPIASSWFTIPILGHPDVLPLSQARFLADTSPNTIRLSLESGLTRYRCAWTPRMTRQEQQMHMQALLAE